MRLVFLCVVVTALLLQAATLGLAGYSYTCKAAETGGAWNVNSTWVECANGVPGVNDTVLVTGPKAVVTIASGQSVSVIRLEIDDSATVANKGSLNAVEIEVDGSKLTSTGKITLASREDNTDFNAGLYAYASDVQLSSDLMISGDSAYIYFSEADVTIGGSVNVSSSDGSNAEVETYSSRLSVGGDFVVEGGLSNGGSDFKRREARERPVERGWFGSIYGSYFETIKGSLMITSRDHMGNTTEEYSTTDSVSLMVGGSQIVVGGDVLIQSGDALVANTGDAALRSAIPSLALTFAPYYILTQTPSGQVVVGGSVTVRSGSVTSLRNDSNSGSTAGSAVFDLVKCDTYINGSKSSLTVQGGSGGSSTTNGGSSGGNGGFETVWVAIGGGTRLMVANDVVVQAGNGGNAGDGETQGGSGGDASVAVIYGGEMLVGGEMSVTGGNGGNTTDQEDAAGYSGRGGAGTVAMINGGSINVAEDLFVSSGSSGLGERGAEAYEAVVIMSTMSQAETTGVPVFAARLATYTDASMPERGSGTPYIASGASNLRVGGDLSIIGGTAGSSSSSSSGASCDANWKANSVDEYVGGLILDNLWDGEAIIGGDINIRGCNGGDSVSSSGGNALPTGIVASGGVSLAVYGSVNVQAGSGGSALASGNRGGDGDSAIVYAVVNSDIDIAGSLTVVAGNGGDLINGTGQPGSVSTGSANTGVIAYSNSHITVQGAVRVNGGRGGSINTTDVNSNNGGSPAQSAVLLYDRSSLVAGSVRVELGTMGNATTSDPSSSSGVEKRSSTTGSSQESQQRRKFLKLAEMLNQDKRGKGPGSTSGVEVNVMSSLISNGDVAVVAGPTSFSTYSSPVGGQPATVSVNGFSTATIRGDLSVAASSCGSTLTDSYTLYEGGSAEIFVGDESVLKAQGNVRLQGADACSGPNSTIGTQGVAYFELTDRAKFFQSGLFVLRDGKGVNVTDPTSSTGIYLSRSEWTVYPCDGAGIEMTQRNSSFFQMETFATFKDCRGAGAKQRYPEPTSDGSADASCSPCTCQEEALSSCPDQSSAALLQANSVVAWLVAGVLQWW